MEKDYDSMTLEELRSLAEANDAEAQCELGKRYFSQSENPKQDDEYNGVTSVQARNIGLQWLLRAAEQEAEGAWYLLAQYYSGVLEDPDDDRDDEINYQEAVKWLRYGMEHDGKVRGVLELSIENGHWEMLKEFLLQLTIDDLDSVTYSEYEAHFFAWAKGIKYLYGLGMEPDVLKGWQLVQKAIANEKQESLAIYEEECEKHPDWKEDLKDSSTLDDLLKHGFDHALEQKEDMQCLRRLLDCGNEEIRENVIQILVNDGGLFISRGLFRAIGDAYDNETEHLEYNKQQAFEWYLRYLHPQTSSLFDGTDWYTDFIEKKMPSYREKGDQLPPWLKIPAENGDARAQYILGDYLWTYNDSSSEHDPVQSVYWFEKAAEQGILDAIMYVVDGYRELPEVADSKAAFDWCNRALKMGYTPYAYFELARAYESGLGTEKDVTKIVPLMEQVLADEKAYSADKKRAIEKLWNCYHEGLGVEKDDIKALSYYQTAAEKGELFAIEKMAEFRANPDCIEDGLHSVLNK